MKAERMTKAEALAHWQGLEGDKPVHLTPVPYKATGSKFGHDGIRIDGSRKFIDSVLGRLTDVMAQENGETRLELNYTETTDRETGQPTGSWVCYVRVHQRGSEAQAMNAFVSGLKGRQVA